MIINILKKNFNHLTVTFTSIVVYIYTNCFSFSNPQKRFQALSLADIKEAQPKCVETSFKRHKALGITKNCFYLDIKKMLLPTRDIN